MCISFSQSSLSLSPDLYFKLHTAALFFHFLDPSENANWLDDFPLSYQLDALARSIKTIIRLVEVKGGYVDWVSDELIGWFSANLAISDGEKLIALRFAYPPRRREAPSLYWSETAGSALDRKYRGHPDGRGREEIGNKLRKNHQAHVVVASEPMSWDVREWQMIRQDEVLVVEGGEEPVLRRFEELRIDDFEKGKPSFHHS